jgi:hypothetical protein
MKTDQNSRILCDCGRVMHSHTVMRDDQRIVRLSCAKHGVRHTRRVIEELRA